MKEQALTLAQWIAEYPELSAEDRAELTAAIATRGRYKGKLRNTKPKAGALGELGWYAIVSNVCAARVSVWFELGLSSERRTVLERLERWSRANRTAINVLGARAFQFNLWDYHHDREACYRILVALRSDGFKAGDHCEAVSRELEAEREAERDTIRNEGRA